MCGRFSIAKSKEEIAKRFNVGFMGNFKPRYNVAPLQVMPVITSKNPNEISFMRWGLVPSWSLDASTAANMINARGETVTSKVPFKHCVKDQRCIIPADGFYEWKKEGKLKVPYRFTLNSEEMFSFAGLWDSWENQDSGEILNTFTIVTTEANRLVSEIHERMPVMLRKDLERLWISESITDSQIASLLKPFDTNSMSSYKAHKAVNAAANDSPDCLLQAPKIYPGETFSLFD
jgi:putative SOS response-associated peptidase YedK